MGTPGTYNDDDNDNDSVKLGKFLKCGGMKMV